MRILINDQQEKELRKLGEIFGTGTITKTITELTKRYLSLKQESEKNKALIERHQEIEYCLKTLKKLL
jgi:hypothetical protein